MTLLRVPPSGGSAIQSILQRELRPPAVRDSVAGMVHVNQRGAGWPTVAFRHTAGMLDARSRIRFR
jgi:hypothetical protein